MAQVTGTRDVQGELAKWLDQCRENGCDSRDIARFLISGALDALGYDEQPDEEKYEWRLAGEDAFVDAVLDTTKEGR